MKFIIGVFLLCSYSIAFANASKEPIVTAEKYMEYKKKNGHHTEFTPPKVVLICYHQSTLQHLLENNPEIKPSCSFKELYLTEDGVVGVLGGWGIGAPALSVKMEELVVLGVKKFIAVGTAGTLMNKHEIGAFIIAQKALAEDGVAHLYLDGETSVKADAELFSVWDAFSKNCAFAVFHPANAWSFSAIFRETPADVIRVTNKGYDVVEMETATLYAIGQKKGVQTLSLFVISDSLTDKVWDPHIKEPKVRSNLHKLSDWVMEFCKNGIK